MYVVQSAIKAYKFLKSKSRLIEIWNLIIWLFVLIQSLSTLKMECLGSILSGSINFLLKWSSALLACLKMRRFITRKVRGSFCTNLKVWFLTWFRSVLRRISILGKTILFWLVLMVLKHCSRWWHVYGSLMLSHWEMERKQIPLRFQDLCLRVGLNLVWLRSTWRRWFILILMPNWDDFDLLWLYHYN